MPALSHSKSGEICPFSYYTPPSITTASPTPMPRIGFTWANRQLCSIMRALHHSPSTTRDPGLGLQVRAASTEPQTEILERTPRKKKKIFLTTNRSSQELRLLQPPRPLDSPTTGHLSHARLGARSEGTLPACPGTPAHSVRATHPWSEEC